MRKKKVIIADSLEALIKEVKTRIKSKPDDINTWGQLMFELLKNSKLNEIAEEFKNLVNILPTLTQFHFDLMAYFVSQGFGQTLIDSFKSKLKKEPNNPTIHYGLGLIYQALEKYDEAIRAFEKATTLKPNLTIAYHNLGIAYFSKRDIDRAIDYTLKAIDIPIVVEAYYSLGMLFLNKGAMILNYFERFIELAPPYLSKYKESAQKQVDQFKKQSQLIKL